MRFIELFGTHDVDGKMMYYTPEVVRRKAMLKKVDECRQQSTPSKEAMKDLKDLKEVQVLVENMGKYVIKLCIINSENLNKYKSHKLNLRYWRGN